ncbi:hypothetical protein [Delftia tsuruhatensis]|uniref:hypothetical protein n=1 Tax=Delftia tsuruhatensis TaxID=180282 RepID=UPI001F2D1774|nr:hypothetical protein [Delftia tsuruhatensis]
MKITRLIHQDPDHHHRRSDGVELVKVPGLGTGKVYFFCDEHDSIWERPEDIGSARGIQTRKSMHIESAGLAEICRAGYGGLVDLFKQFDTHTKRAEYLPLKSGSDTMAFFSGILSATPILFCNIRNFHDERLYYAALDGSSVWRFPEDVHSPVRAMQGHGLGIVPAPVLSIFESHLVDHVFGIREYLKLKGRIHATRSMEFTQER